ncbi:VOC family protein [Tuwongella immobilis]|uniref:PhnB-like domain-containing protein n=1 Tax=Tuwongella immobilis TaxID=692036 RepID=A0A6C2YPM7_9BACT|nr:VOC family protein [Tuwongella immobilis]VIP02842.1 glyoxalase : 3-demethylubiquinone-9 3-methyltransferase OS=Aeromonas hydrophila 4AK4 GN=AH4AK4_3326 PE=4 SV=1: 3-dmu-9_3-mt [Tuwongella immobilis]VTS02614.1 glyoxalase : 3-demethylubiquinone-9 3-methyltransferase OS=Aeromonas hydrophila 4AK4 GN=AH4AK4_3326 PE=4 SV=1: 3-dmu-9_3-mt [Tuwongella immobilis]
MARVCTYLNFARETEAAFEHYRTIFGGDFLGKVHRFRDVPTMPGQPAIEEADANLIMHIELELLGGHVLMGTDAPECMGFTITQGNNVHIHLEPDSRAEGDRLFAALSDGGTPEMPMQEVFWGAYFGSLTDRFGIKWMINVPGTATM